MGIEALADQVADTDGARRDTLVLSNKRRVPLDAAESLSLGTRVRVYWAGDGTWYARKDHQCREARPPDPLRRW